MARLFLWSSLFLALVAAADYHRPLQHPLILQPAASIAPRELTGRFLHLTDIHPDLFYRANSSVSEACHWKDKSDKHGPKAGYWGTKASDCDSPATLVDAVFDWLEKHVKDQVDFVVWTGDNARHDIDSRKPRSLKEIMELNKWIGKRMKEVFGHLPVVSSVGNNGECCTCLCYTMRDNTTDTRICWARHRLVSAQHHVSWSFSCDKWPLAVRSPPPLHPSLGT